MIDCILDRLQANGGSQRRIDCPRAVAGGQYRLIIGAAVLVGANPVVYAEAAGACQLCRRQHPDAHHNSVGGMAAVSGFHAIHVAFTGEAADLRALANAYAGIPVQSGQPIGHRSADRPAHQAAFGFKHGNFRPGLLRGCGDLKAYIATAHDDDTPVGTKLAA